MSSRLALAAPEPAHLLGEHAELLRNAARLGPLLDLACGRGRNTLAAARLGARVIAVDRSDAALREVAEAAALAGAPVDTVRVDLEAAGGLPLRAGCFGGVLVFRYLHRPLAPLIAPLLRPGGVLLYETFTHHQRERPQGPSNPAFLLQDGELPRLFPGLRVIAHREPDPGEPTGPALASLVAQHP